jgi:hypothetical protein
VALTLLFDVPFLCICRAEDYVVLRLNNNIKQDPGNAGTKGTTLIEDDEDQNGDNNVPGAIHAVVLTVIIIASIHIASIIRRKKFEFRKSSTYKIIYYMH